MFKLLSLETFSSANESDVQGKADEKLEDGEFLPDDLRVTLAEHLTGKPLEEIDPGRNKLETFVVIGRRGIINRFASGKSLFVFDSLSLLRQTCIVVSLHSLWFYLTATLVCVTAVIATMPPNESTHRIITLLQILYQLEMVVAIIARGFLFQTHSYLRNRWRVIDFIANITFGLTFVTSDNRFLHLFPYIRPWLRVLELLSFSKRMRYGLRSIYICTKNILPILFITLVAGRFLTFLADGTALMESRQVCVPYYRHHDWKLVHAGELILARPCTKFNGSHGVVSDTCPRDYFCGYITSSGDSAGGRLEKTYFDSMLRILLKDRTEVVFTNFTLMAGAWTTSVFALVSSFVLHFMCWNLIVATIASTCSSLDISFEWPAKKQIAPSPEPYLYQRKLRDFVTHPIFELLSLAVIAIHCVTLGIDRHDMSQLEYDIFRTGLYGVALFLVIELLLKLFAGCSYVRKDALTFYDTTLLGLAVVGYVVVLSLEGIPGLSILHILGFVGVLRSFRFLFLFSFRPFTMTCQAIVHRGKKLLYVAYSSLAVLLVMSFVMLNLNNPTYDGHYYQDFFHSFIAMFIASTGSIQVANTAGVHDTFVTMIYLLVIAMSHFVIFNISLGILLPSMNPSKSHTVYESIESLRDYFCKRRKLRSNSAEQEFVRLESAFENNEDEEQANEAVATNTSGNTSPTLQLPDVIGNGVTLRSRTQNALLHPITEFISLALPVAYLASYVLEDGLQRNESEIGSHARKVILALIALETLLKLVSFGPRRYFATSWWIFEFGVALASTVEAVRGGIGANDFGDALPTLLLLKLVKSAMRIDTCKSAWEMFGASTRNCFVVMCILAFSWLFFAILAVSMFAGKFHSCLHANGSKAEDFYNRDACLASKEHSWTRPHLNFDNIFNSYWTLFHIATFGGWLDVAFSAASSRQIDEQPQDDVNPYTFIYFVAFIYFASYVGLKFFTFACIDVVREQRSLRCNGDESFNIRLQRYADEHTLSPVSKNVSRLQTIVSSRYFGALSLLHITISLLVIFTEVIFYDHKTHRLPIYASIAILAALETFAQLAASQGLRKFLSDPFNLVDSVAVILAFIQLCVPSFLDSSASPSVLRAFRYLIAGDLFAGRKSRATLLPLLVMQRAFGSVAALFSLLLLITTIYSCLGLGMFSAGAFVDFKSSFATMVQISTLSGWHKVSRSLSEDQFAKSFLFVVSFLFLVGFVLYNLAAAVVIEFFREVHEELRFGFTSLDVERFATSFLAFAGSNNVSRDKLPNLVRQLPEPFNITEPDMLGRFLHSEDLANSNPIGEVSSRDLLCAYVKYFTDKRPTEISVN